MPERSHILSIGAGATDECLAQAADVLARRTGTVRLEEAIALRATRTRLICEVMDPTPSAHSCEHEYEVLVENAKRALDASALGQRLPAVPRQWLVVADDGSGPAVLWRAP
jgi:hypothetical protein